MFSKKDALEYIIGLIRKHARCFDTTPTDDEQQKKVCSICIHSQGLSTLRAWMIRKMIEKVGSSLLLTIDEEK